MAAHGGLHPAHPWDRLLAAWQRTSSLATRARWVASIIGLARWRLPYSNAVQASISQLEPPCFRPEQSRLTRILAWGSLSRRVVAKRVLSAGPQGSSQRITTKLFEALILWYNRGWPDHYYAEMSDAQAKARNQARTFARDLARTG